MQESKSHQLQQLQSRLSVPTVSYTAAFPVLTEETIQFIQSHSADYIQEPSPRPDNSRRQERRRKKHGQHAFDFKPKPVSRSPSFELHLAVARQQVDQVENVLLAHRKGHFNINEEVFGGLRAIQIAAQVGNCEILHILKVYGAAFVTEKSPVHPLFIAVKHNRLEMVKVLLADYHVNPNLRGSKGETALHLAVEENHEAMCRLLIGCGACVDSQDNAGFTPLLVSALRGNVRLVKLLKAAGADFGLRTKQGQYAFHFKALHAEFVRELKKYRGFYSVSDGRDWTCVHYAVCGGNLPAVREILKHGIHQLDVQTSDRYTVLSLACACGQHEIVDYLFSRYYSRGRRAVPDYETSYKDQHRLVHVTAQYGNLDTLLVLAKHGQLFVNAQTPKRKFSPLHIACDSQNEQITCFLLENGADVRAKDSKGWYALHYAAQNNQVRIVNLMISSFSPDDFPTSVNATTPLHLATKSGCTQVVKILIKAKFDPTTVDQLGYAAIHYAASRGFTEIVRSLMEAGAKIHRVSLFSETPMFLACINGHAAVVKLLKRAGANVNIPNQEGKKAVHEACSRGFVEVVDAICAQPRMRFDIDGLNSAGLSPLHVACAHGQFDIAGLLVREGADVDLQDDKGLTAMHHAAARGHSDIVRSLVQVGARTRLKDNEGLTPAQLAAKHKHPEVERLLTTTPRPRSNIALDTSSQLQNTSSHHSNSFNRERRSSSRVSFSDFS